MPIIPGPPGGGSWEGQATERRNVDEKTGSPALLAMGFMCGTSLDGIDGALVSVDRGRIRLLAFEQSPFPVVWRQWLKRWMSGKSDFGDPSRFIPDLADLFSQREEQVGQALLEKSGFTARDLSAIGTHGVTVRHQPGPHPFEPFPGKPGIRGVSYQFSNPFHLARTFRTPVVSQFRGADLVAGGCGAPLAPVLHRALFTANEPRAFLNIGGIANLTFLPDSRSETPVIAFDTGPGNMLLDLAVLRLTQGQQSFDAQGQWSQSGQVIIPLLEKLRSDPFFSLYPPKSTGAEEWGAGRLEQVFEDCTTLAVDPYDRPQDFLATITELTASEIEGALRFLPEPPARIIVGGGGVNNHFLLKRIGERTGLPVQSSLEFGFPPQAIESIAFAYLSLLTLSGRSGAIRTVTGAREEALLGQITPVPGEPFLAFLRDVEARADIHLPSPDRPKISS